LIPLETIERGLQQFLEVGTALKTISEHRHYRERHATFHDYCRDWWDPGARRAYQLIGSARVVEAISAPPTTPKRCEPLVHTATPRVLPTSERQVRPLVALPADEQRAAWTRAVEMCGGRAPSGREVAAAARSSKPAPAWEPPSRTVIDALDARRAAAQLRKVYPGRRLMGLLEELYRLCGVAERRARKKIAERKGELRWPACSSRKVRRST
jgi:hypothetical protein